MEVTEKLVNLGAALVANKLVVGPGGNISMRDGDSCYVSPSGFALGEMLEEDLVCVNIGTAEYDHEANRPTCEYLMHVSIYRARPEVNVIVHAHPPYVIGVCSAGTRIRPMTPDAAAFLHPIGEIPYVVPGGTELADAASQALCEPCNALTMVNHGAITLGQSCREAYMRMEVLEDAAKTQFIAASAGTPMFFSDEQIEQINNLSVEKYRKKLAAESD